MRSYYSTTVQAGPRPVPLWSRGWTRPAGLSDRRVAAHEVSHALVACRLLGRPVSGLTIIPERRPTGGTFQGTTTYGFYLFDCKPADAAVIAISGAVGEQLRFGGDIWEHAGEPDDPASDRFSFDKAIREQAAKLGHPGCPIIQEAYRQIAVETAGKLLNVNWDALLRLEEQLTRRVELDGPEVEAIIGKR